MTLRYADRVREQTTAYSAAAFRLATQGAWFAGFQTFANIGLAIGDTIYYIAVDNLGNVEIALGTWTAAGTLARPVQVLSGSNGTAAASFVGAVTLANAVPAAVTAALTGGAAGAPVTLPAKALLAQNGQPLLTANNQILVAQ